MRRTALLAMGLVVWTACDDERIRPASTGAESEEPEALVDASVGRSDATARDATPRDAGAGDAAPAGDAAGRDGGRIEDVGPGPALDAAVSCGALPSGPAVLFAGPYSLGQRLSWIGDRYGAGWQRLTAGNMTDIWFTFLDIAGRPVGPGHVVSPNPETNERYEHVRFAYSGRETGVVYAFTGSVRSATRSVGYFERLDAGGQPIANSRRSFLGPRTSETFALAVAWNPLDRLWLVAWTDVEFATRRVLIDEAGALVPGSERVMQGEMMWDTGGTPLIWVRDRFVVVTTFYDMADEWRTRVRVTELDRHGEILGSSSIGDRGAHVAVRPTLTVAGDAGEIGVVWVGGDLPYPRQQTHFARVRIGQGWVPGSVIALGDPSDIADGPDVAFDGSEYLVVWQLDLSSHWDLVTARIDARGTVTVPPSRMGAPPPIDEGWPNVVWNGCQFALSWMRSERGAIGGDVRVDLLLFR